MPADGLNFRRNFFGVTRGRAFEQHFCQQHRGAVVGSRLRQDTALKHRAKFHKRQTVILLHQELQPVRQFDFLDGMVGVALDVRLGLGRGAFRQQRIQCPVFRREIMSRHPLDVGGGHLFDRREITFGKIQVVRRQPVAAEILGLAFHRLARGQRGRDELLHGLVQFVGRHGKRPDFIDLGQNRITGRLKFIAVHYGADAEKSR